jgi:fibroblast growth factor receptor 1
VQESASEKEKKDLVQELAVMKMLDPHPNVVKLLGCCTEKGKHQAKLRCL